MNRIRIAFLIHTLQSGGAEGQLVEWLRGLPPEEFDRRVICLVKGGFHEEAVREMGVPIEILGYRPMRRHDGSLDFGAAFTFVPALFRLIGSLRRSRPHILQTVLLMSDVMGAMAVNRVHPRPRLIGSRRALTDCARLGTIRRAILKRAVRKADAIVCNSDAVAEDVIQSQGADPSHIHKIYNGVDWNRFAAARAQRDAVRTSLGLGPDEKALGCIAQLRPEKDHGSLLKAFARVRESHPETILFLVGAGPMEPDVRALAAQLEIDKSIRLLGVRKDIAELCSAFDMLVLPSRTEGFSNVILEGMAAGLPIVTTRVGGNPEALDDGRCGLLVTPDDPDAFAEAIARYLDNPAFAAQIAEAAFSRAREVFSIEALHRNTREFYKGLVPPPARG